MSPYYNEQSGLVAFDSEKGIPPPSQVLLDVHARIAKILDETGLGDTIPATAERRMHSTCLGFDGTMYLDLLT
jgi:hypothetical protein